MDCYSSSLQREYQQFGKGMSSHAPLGRALITTLLIVKHFWTTLVEAQPSTIR